MAHAYNDPIAFGRAGTARTLNCTVIGLLGDRKRTRTSAAVAEVAIRLPFARQDFVLEADASGFVMPDIVVSQRLDEPLPSRIRIADNSQRYDPMQGASSRRATSLQFATCQGGAVRYIPPFAVIKESVEISTSKGQLIATATYENLIRIIKLLVSGLEVDEDWYLLQYPDVAAAVAEGTIISARQHFVDDGYFEGRLPIAMEVDERWYNKEYPDVAESIRKGDEPSAQAHFLREGYKEGRLPFPP
jgi:hypothetical protein